MITHHDMLLDIHQTIFNSTFLSNILEPTIFFFTKLQNLSRSWDANCLQHLVYISPLNNGSSQDLSISVFLHKQTLHFPTSLVDPSLSEKEALKFWSCFKIKEPNSPSPYLMPKTQIRQELNHCLRNK